MPSCQRWSPLYKVDRLLHFFSPFIQSFNPSFRVGEEHMDSSTSSCSVIIVGAGISGIMSAKVLAENRIDDFLILEAADRIGGRLMKHEFAGFTVEGGAGWVAGVGGNKMNPIWELANKHSLRTCYSDYSNAAFNIYDPSGARVPGSVAVASYDLAVESANRALAAIEAASNMVEASSTMEEIKSNEFVPSTPLELAIDYILHDFEMAEVEPIPTFTEFGEREFMVADDRGYEYILPKLAEEFLEYSDSGHVVDERLKLNKVAREIQYNSHGVTVKTEDGSVYKGNYAISSVSLGVLRSDLLKFNPPLPCWKTRTFFNCDIRTYTKIFLKYSSKFWSTGDGTEFFLYAGEKRGYYTFGQHMENAYPGSNILVVTVTDEESKRVEEQGDEETKVEAMSVLRKMFGADIPEAEQILVPKWWNNRFQRGSYSNYPIFVDKKHFHDIRAPVGPVCFTGEHTSEKFNGYVHGAYLSDTENSSDEDLLAFYQKSKSSLAKKSVQFRFAGTNMVSKVALGQRLSHFVLVLYEHAVATVMLMLFTFILDKKTRPHLSFSTFSENFGRIFLGLTVGKSRPNLSFSTFSEIFGRIFLGLRVGKSRGGIALLLIMIIAFTSKAAAVIVDNTETIYSADEDIPVGDKLPPSCYYVATCGDCFPCPPKGHGFLCCDGL